jgi:diacylglycerol kinase family enzyme
VTRVDQKFLRSGPGRLALLVNPSTTTGPHDIARLHELAVRLDVVDMAMTSPDDPGGASNIERWVRLGVRAIAVIGGDGTLASVLTAVHEAGYTHELDVVLLDGGSLGLVAGLLGARDAWKRALDSNRAAPLVYGSARLPTLETDAGLGFVVGAGVVASVSRDFQRSRRTRTNLVGYATARILSAICGASSSLLDGYHGTLEVDSDRVPGDRWQGVLVTSLLHLGRGSDPRSLRRDQLYTLALRAGGGAAVLPKLRDLVAGRWAAETRAAKQVRFESPGPFDVLADGEFREVRRALMVRQGPTFQAWIPRIGVASRLTGCPKTLPINPELAHARPQGVWVDVEHTRRSA